jgi:hypothetical protein
MRSIEPMTYARVVSLLSAWIEASLDLSLWQADLDPVALPASFYADEAEPEEVAIALRLQQQLLRAA